MSDKRNTAGIGSAKRRTSREAVIIGLPAHAAELRIMAATAHFHAVRQIFARTTRGTKNA